MGTDFTELLLSLALGATLPYALVAVGDWVNGRRNAPGRGTRAPKQG